MEVFYERTCKGNNLSNLRTMIKYMDTMLSDNPNIRKRLYEQFNARICLLNS